MKTRRTYVSLSTEKLAISLESKILAGSIVCSSTSVVIPMGQEVDTYNFSTADFSHEWDVTSGN